jgi:glycosyltransferase involved in cell wall biosynthesis
VIDGDETFVRTSIGCHRSAPELDLFVSQSCLRGATEGSKQIHFEDTLPPVLPSSLCGRRRPANMRPLHGHCDRRVGMRILQIHNRHRYAGGEDAVVEKERELLLEAGFEVSSFIVDNPASGVKATAAMLRSPWNSSAAKTAVAALERFQPDLVHVHNTWFSLSSAILPALAQTGVPVVMTLHNYRSACINANLLRDGRPCELCVGSGAWSGVRHRCYRGSTVLSGLAATAVMVPRWRGIWDRDVTSFIALDEAAIPQLVASGIPGDRITVRSNFAGDPGPRQYPPSESDEVIYAGRLSEEKGVTILVDAWRQAHPDGLHLTLFGDGPLRTELEANGAPNMTLAGRIDHASLTGRMLAARALVFPSTCREAGPLAPIEAAAAGLPVVTTSDIGMARRLEASEAGWSVRPSDTDALAGVLAKLRLGAEVDRRGERSRLLFESDYTPAHALASLTRIYEDAVLHPGNRAVNGSETRRKPA